MYCPATGQTLEETSALFSEQCEGFFWDWVQTRVHMQKATYMPLSYMLLSSDVDWALEEGNTKCVG